MSTTTTMFSWPKVTADLLLIAPLISALAGYNWSGLIPSVPSLVTAIVIGALAKTLIGFAQDPNLSNWEDLIGFVVIFLGLLASAFTANALFVEYGTVIGLLAKALGFLQTGINVEDILLAIGALIAGYGTLTGNAELFNAGSLIALVGKSLPSIGTGGMAGNPSASQPAAPVQPAKAG